MPAPTFRPPAGYYQADDVNYPQRPAAIGGITDLLGNPAGRGSNMMGDPYTDEEMAATANAPLMKAPGVPLPPPSADPATRAAVTRLQPSRTSAFSSRDAQALQSLDPRALAEAQSLADLDKPKTMTGEFGGKKFEMTPNARVDRNALAGLYNKYQAKQGQERQDAVRTQEQGGRERIVSIPGEQATKRREMELGTEERLAGKKIEADAPGRAADIAAKQAQTASVTGAEGRAQAQAARQPSPQQEAIDQALAEAQASPFAATPAGRARIMALHKISTAGKAMPPEASAAVAEGAAPPAPDIGEATAAIMADPGMAQLIEQAKSTKPGVFTGSQGRQTNAAARTLAERAIRARLARSGMAPDEAQAFITSILGPSQTYRL